VAFDKNEPPAVFTNEEGDDPVVGAQSFKSSTSPIASRRRKGEIFRTFHITKKLLRSVYTVNEAL